MEVSRSFSIHPREPWVAAHNAKVREVVAAFQADWPIRVPLFAGEWSGQHGFYADETGLDYRRYYTDPDEMLRVQLEAARRRRELPIYDMVLGEPPEHWEAAVDLWPVVGPGWVGCRILYREHSTIAHQGLHLSKEEADAMEMPDPRTGGLLATSRRFHQYLQERYAGKLTFLERPLASVSSGVGTNGAFSLALDVRGAEIMWDMYEDPEFTHRFLRKVYSWCEALEETWHGPTHGRGYGHSDHGIDMLSPTTYESFIVPRILEMNRQRGAEIPTALHHCGRGAHLFPLMKRYFGLTSISALTYPLVDIAKVRRDLGEEVWIQGHLEESIVTQGPPERIRQTVRELMASGAKGRGRFALMVGDMVRGTPLEHRLALYEAVKEFGAYAH